MPHISASAFIAENATIIGDVTIGDETGIWYGCVVRGDVNLIKIGKRTNIQDGTVIHVWRNKELGATIIGDEVTVGHKAMLHACELQDRCFIGMGAIIMDKAVVEEGGMVAAGTLISPGKIVRSGEIWAGNPGRFFRKMTEEESNFIVESADNYVQHAIEYLEQQRQQKAEISK